MNLEVEVADSLNSWVDTWLKVRGTDILAYLRRYLNDVA